MGDQRALDLGGAEAMARDVDDVVHSSRQPIETVLVPPGAVAGEVEPRKGREISLHETLVIAKNRTHHSRPRAGDTQISFAGTVDHIVVVVDDYRFNAEEGPRRRSRLQWRRARDRGDQDAAGFGLPPSVDDRAALLADMIVVPQPRLGVDRFTDTAEDPQ